MILKCLFNQVVYKALFFTAAGGLRRDETASGCQTGIIRTGFSAADFRLNRVIRLANTSGY